MTVEALGPDGAPPIQSGRRLIPGLATPFPMINYTSAMLIEDPVAQMICSSLDEVLAPIISVLDCYDSYLDTEIAPIDFVLYMCTWILVQMPVGWEDKTVRRTLSHAIQFYARRGTAGGLKTAAAEIFGLDVSLTESGSVTVSQDHTDPATWPTAPLPAVNLTVRSLSGAPVDMSIFEVLLNAGVPANVECTATEAS